VPDVHEQVCRPRHLFPTPVNESSVLKHESALGLTLPIVVPPAGQAVRPISLTALKNPTPAGEQVRSLATSRKYPASQLVSSNVVHPVLNIAAVPMPLVYEQVLVPLPMTSPPE
jgi:hypothetical protein